MQMFVSPESSNAQLAWQTILQQSTQGVPTLWINMMQHDHLEQIAGLPPGSYRTHPEETYMACQRAMGACALDQYIPLNPMSMGNQGYEGTTHRGPTTGGAQLVLDGICIDTPESVVEHLEKFVFPRLEAQTKAFDEHKRALGIVAGEIALQQKLGDDILKTGYGFISFPHLRYTTYGYEPYLMAYVLYPEVMERDFSLQADLALRNNRAAARVYRDAGLPPMYRLDHDMADSRGTLVDILSLDQLWFPHFARCLTPLRDTDVRLLWHCDGNLMPMVPRLIDCGVSGFQGFQYEDGMDYERICRMRTPDGRPLVIMAGVSVTRTLPMGSPSDVRDELKWLVETGPPVGLFLGCSSSVTPGVPKENIQVLVEGLHYYRTHGR